MIKHYLFDWGDTLMVDLPNQRGPMCEWPQIQVVTGALACLKHLNQTGLCHLATNAEESTEVQIRQALKRAGLSEFITQIFCRENLGMGKTHEHYYPKIITQLDTPAQQVIMVGDSLQRDVLIPLKYGLQAVWFNPNNQETTEDISIIEKLSDLF